MEEQSRNQDFDIFDELSKLPQVVSHYVLGSGVAEDNRKVFEKYKISDEIREKILQLENLVFFGKIPLNEFITNVDTLTKERQVAIFLVSTIFFPLNDFLERRPEKFLREQKQDLARFTKTRIQVRTATPDAIVKEALGTSSIKIDDPILANRLRQILETFVHGIRDRLEIKNILVRSQKIGGIGLGDAAADELLENVIAKQREVKLVDIEPIREISQDKPILQKESEDSSKPIRSNNLPIESKPSFPKTEITISRQPSDMLEPDAEKEITHVMAMIPPSSLDITNQIKKSVAKVYEQSGMNFEDQAMRYRFGTIASNRLKDIRDSLETKELLMRSGNLGGLGLSEDVANKIVAALDSEFRAIYDSLRAVKDAESSVMLRKRFEAEEAQKVRKSANEKTELDAHFEELTKKKHVGKPEPISPIKPTRPISPIVPIGLIKHEDSKNSATVSPKLSLDDVKYTPKLVGPIEELGSFSLQDLERLAPDPDEAALRILDKLEVLRSESLEKKIAGIQALRASPLYKLYAEILAEALIAGKNPRAIIEARRTALQPTLNDAEFNGIMKLNANLRF